MGVGVTMRALRVFTWLGRVPAAGNRPECPRCMASPSKAGWHLIYA